MGLFDRFRARISDTRTQDDVGPQVIDFLFSSMKIDEEWGIRESRGFTWWGHLLAQRVWADPPRNRNGTPVVRLHAETGLLRGLAPTDGLLARLDLLNKVASLSAFVWHPDSQRLTMHAAMTFNEENVEWAKRLFLSAVAYKRPTHISRYHWRSCSTRSPMSPLIQRTGSDPSQTTCWISSAPSLPRKGRALHHLPRQNSRALWLQIPSHGYWQTRMPQG